MADWMTQDLQGKLPHQNKLQEKKKKERAKLAAPQSKKSVPASRPSPAADAEKHSYSMSASSIS